MVSGGARANSGPPPDPNSARSMGKGLSLTALPPEGYEGPIPAIPIPGFSARERKVWRSLWRSPQAAGWAVNEWLHHAVAMYARTLVRCEDPDVKSGVLAQLHRFAEQIGMTDRGLKMLGWQIATKVEDGDLPGTKTKERASSKDRISLKKT